jgi:hypothetical protein
MPDCLSDCDMFDFIASGSVGDCAVISRWPGNSCQGDCSVNDLSHFEETKRDFCAEGEEERDGNAATARKGFTVNAVIAIALGTAAVLLLFFAIRRCCKTGAPKRCVKNS